MVQDTEMCVSWDFTVQDWTPRGCTTLVGEDGIVTCICNHLTNFAVLVVMFHALIFMYVQLNDVYDFQHQDICFRERDCERSRVDQPLTYISYIGISVSIVCLVFTLLTLLIFK